MTVMNSWKLMTSSLSASVSHIVAVSSQNVSGWPIQAMDRANSGIEMYPFPSRPKERNTSRSARSQICLLSINKKNGIEVGLDHPPGDA